MKNLLLNIVLGMTISLNASGALIHQYNFDSDASDSVGNADGTLVDNANVSGGMLNLDGAGDYVQIASHIVPTSGSYSVAMFFLQSVSQTGYIELISQGSTGGPGFYLGQSANLNIRATDGWQDTGIAFPAAGQMHHLSLVVDGTAGESRLYHDGILQTTMPSALSTTPNGTATRFGRQFEPFAEFYKGSIDDIRIYDNALTDAEVLSLANISSVPVPAAIWLFSSGLLGLISFRGKWAR